MIKAYHQVGSDAWEKQELQAAYDEVLAHGSIEPAIHRLDRSEMEKECFDKKRDADLTQRFPDASSHARTALAQMARDKISELAETGSTYSLFNCVDMLAGDLELVFLRPYNWYAVDNGFVFEAAELIRKGAKLRRADALGAYGAIIGETAKQKYPSVAAARKALERELRDVREYVEHGGSTALDLLKDGVPGDSEIVWRGSLPLSLAIEGWRYGRKAALERRR